MGKHFKEEAKSKPVENSNDDSFYGRIITRQGEGLVEAQKQIKQLEDRLVEERMNRIEDLRNIKAFISKLFLKRLYKHSYCYFNRNNARSQ